MKTQWQIVLEEHADYMATLVTVASNKYKGEDAENSLLANLVDRDDLTHLCVGAFEKAYAAWDGERPFKPLYRTVYLNMAENLARVERRHRLKETTMFPEGWMENTSDPCSFRIPVEIIDFWDWVNSLPSAHKALVLAILNASELLGVTDTHPQRVQGKLKEYATKIVGMSVRQYYKAFGEIRKMLEERSKNGTHKIWYENQGYANIQN